MTENFEKTYSYLTNLVTGVKNTAKDYIHEYTNKNKQYKLDLMNNLFIIKSVDGEKTIYSLSKLTEYSYVVVNKNNFSILGCFTDNKKAEEMLGEMLEIDDNMNLRIIKIKNDEYLDRPIYIQE